MRFNSMSSAVDPMVGRASMVQAGSQRQAAQAAAAPRQPLQGGSTHARAQLQSAQPRHPEHQGSLSLTHDFMGSAQQAAEQLEHVLHTCGPALYRHMCTGSRRALRLACKAGCSAVDNSVGSLKNADVAFHTPQPVDVRTLRAAQNASGAVQLPDARWVGVQRLEIRGIGFGLMHLPQLPPKLAALSISWLTWTAPEQERFAGIAALAGSLRQLQLIDNDVGAGGMARLADALSRLTGLQHLQLQGHKPNGHTGMDNEALITLAPALRCLTRLTHLELDSSGNPRNGPAVGAKLAQSLAVLTLLEVLILRVLFNEHDAAELAQALTALTRLQRLSLVALRAQGNDDMDFCGHITQPLARAIPALPSLQHLGISSVYQSNELVRLLQDVSGLRSLSLDIRRDDRQAQSEADNSTSLEGAVLNMTQLTSLRVEGCDSSLALAIGPLTLLQELDVPSGVMDRLLTSPPLLGGLRHLTQLRLYNDYASEYRGPLSCAQHAKLLVEQLPNLTQLRSLNAGGALGLRVAPLRHLVFLQELDLYDCGIGPKAAPALAQALLHTPALQRLDIADNCFNARSARALAPSLAKLAQLQEFGAHNNTWGYEGMCALLRALKQCSGLTVVKIWACARLEEGEACVVAGLLCELKGLRCLDAAWNGDLGKRCQQLVAGLPYLERLYCT